MSTALEPDRNQIEIFVDALLRHRGEEGYLSLRVFQHDNTPLFQRMWPARLNGSGNGFQHLIDHAVDLARRAANNPEPSVFCPPLAVFNAANGWQAREQDLLKGLALSVECDQQPEEARCKLQEILGECTAVVRSGGQWVDGDGRAEDKLHLHWRLKSPAIGAALAKLKRARELATAIGGGDTSNINAVHPLRWPGSWHRKGTPRLCELVSVSPDREIDLDAALAVLEAAAPHLPPSAQAHQPAEPQASVERVAAALAVIPNNEGWDAWNNIGMATWRATGGSARGFAAFDAWSQKSPNYDASNTAKKWSEYFRSPPTQIGAGTIFHLADQASPNWRQGEPPEPEPGDPGPEPPQEPQLPRLQWVNMSGWDDVPPPEQDWTVPGIIPARQVTLFSGHGGAGKSTSGLHLTAAHVVAGSWLHWRPEPGPAFFIDAEDEEKVIHRRLGYVTQYLGVKFKDLIAGGLHILPLAGEDAVMAATNRMGVVEPTMLYHRILEAASDIKPKQTVIASAGNVFAGNENIRSEVTQFVGLLTKIAIRTGGSVVLISHPSLTGMANKSGISGSTQWHNIVRARMYLTSPKSEEDAQPDDGLRTLEFSKNQYGARGKSIMLRFRDGLFLPEASEGTFEQRMREVERGILFMDLLRQFTERGRNVSDKPSPSYAPTVFAADPKARAAKATKEALADAMAKLFAAGKIRVVTEGSPARQRSRIVEVSAPSNDPSDPPSNGLPTPSNALSSHTPHTPHPVGSGQGGVGRPARSNGEDNEGSSADPQPSEVRSWSLVNDCPQAWACCFCGEDGNGEKGKVARFKPNQPGAPATVLHACCADGYFQRR